jgi:hypothetical protein
MARSAFLAPSATSFYRTSVKHFQHPAAGRLDLKLLASWAAIVNRAAAGP